VAVRAEFLGEIASADEEITFSTAAVIYLVSIDQLADLDRARVRSGRQAPGHRGGDWGQRSLGGGQQLVSRLNLPSVEIELTITGTRRCSYRKYGRSTHAKPGPARLSRITWADCKLRTDPVQIKITIARWP